uniref:Transposase (putative) YhgA-like domain-containing protein n=1 Tax=Eubacterium plexicaudatum ASF492 TaxID=1235802 RepID=N2A399_9FIRM
MAVKNKLKPDIVLKNFWRDNDRFADLFNGSLFHGEKILQPDMLSESDTDVSSVLKFNGHAETLGRILDVVKKSSYGIDFVILGLENQMKVHYAMPLRNMTADALIYMKEYSETVKRNKQSEPLQNDAEFLSGLRREDRLHAVVTICVYYGETAWDGPYSLLDMLDMQHIPKQLRSFVNDYKINLIQIHGSEEYRFQNSDVQDFFEIMRNIYRRDYRKIEEVYKTREISTELGLAIGAASESTVLMNEALKSRGGVMNMCTALQELENTSREKGRIEGKIEGRIEGKIEGKIEGIVKICKDFGAPQETAVEKLQKECDLTLQDARKYVKMYYL